MKNNFFRILLAILIQLFMLDEYAYAKIKDKNCPSIGKGWTDFASGACQLDLALKLDDKTYSVKGFRFDMNKYSIELVDSVNYFENISKKSKNSLNYTLNELISLLVNDNIVISPIGYPQVPGDPVPQGLIKINGKQIWDLTKNKEAKRYLTGILCLDKHKSLDNKIKSMVTTPIVYCVGQQCPNDDDELIWKDQRCSNAIQIGPRIIGRPERGLVEKELSSQSEDRITLSIGGKERFIYLLYWENITLKRIQDILLKGIVGNSGETYWAVNISLRDLAGIGGKDVKIGELDSTNPAYLLFKPIIN